VKLRHYGAIQIYIIVSAQGPSFLLMVSGIGLSRYIAVTNLSIIAVFVEYLRQFLIDLNQIYRHSSVPKTRLREFFQLLSSSGFTARRRRDFFVT